MATPNRYRDDTRYPRPDWVDDVILNGLELVGEGGKSYNARRPDGKVIRVHKRAWKPGKSGMIVPREDRGIAWNATDGALALTPSLSLKVQRDKIVAARTPAPPPMPPEPPVVPAVVEGQAPAKRDPQPPVDGPVAISYSVLATQQAKAIDTIAARLDAFARLLIELDEKVDRILTIVEPLA